MRISELIKKLQILEKMNGDTDLTFSVNDSYSIHGKPMNLDLRVGSEGWLGSSSHDDWTDINFSLSSGQGEYSEITHTNQ